MPIAVTLHGFVANTSQKAGDVYSPAGPVLFNAAGAARDISGVTAADIAAKCDCANSRAGGTSLSRTDCGLWITDNRCGQATQFPSN